MPEVDENSELNDEENMYSNDPGNGKVDAETGKIKNGDDNSKKSSGNKKI